MTDLITKYVYTGVSGSNISQQSGTAVLDDVNSITIDLGSELKNNSMRVELKNGAMDVFSDGNIRHRWINTDGTPVFKAIKTTKGQVIDEEYIDVYAVYTDTDPTINVEIDDYLLMTGVITKPTIKGKTDSSAIELGCKDRNTMVLDKLVIPHQYRNDDTNAPDGIGWRAPTIIQHLLRNAVDGLTSKQYGFYTDGKTNDGNPFGIDARLFSAGVVNNGTTSTTKTGTRKLITDSSVFTTSAIKKGYYVRNSSGTSTTTARDSYAYVISVDSGTAITLSKDIFTGTATTYHISTGFIQDRRPDSTLFPVISFAMYDKPVMEAIGALSQIDQTNTAAETDSESGTLVIKRGARWHLDNLYRFHWYIPDDTPEHIFRLGQTEAISPDTVNHIIHDSELTQEVDNKINFIVFRAGEDMNNNMIRSSHRATFSGTPNKKDALRNWMHIARNMKAEDFLSVGTATTGNIQKSTGDIYLYPSSFPMTPRWDRQQRSIPNSAGTATTYNANFKEEAIIRGKILAQKIFQGQANPRWEGKIVIRGENIVVGDLIRYTDKRYGINNILVRVKQVTHNISADQGWITNLSVEEDENEQTIST